ncbi:MAG: molybdopterin guanine dinucleotide synthesis protein B [Anaeroglobus sp.]|nr:molybdopterin guanine dinucleotide synthesis protein B [Anaeroglobus sp.]
MKRHDKMSALSLLILAGGKSSRMKKDKSQLPWQDSTTLTHLLTNSYVYPFERTVISANRIIEPQELPDFIRKKTKQREHTTEYIHLSDNRRLSVVSDLYTDCGPLGGMEAAMRLYPSDGWLILAVDLPFYDFSRLPALLAADTPEYDAVIPVINGQENPLAALYKGRVYEKIRTALADGDYRVRKIYNKKAAFIDETPYARQYLNMNTPIAYKEALACAANQSRPVPVVSITAETSGTGKTHLTTQIIKELSDQGYKVGYVKSTHHMPSGPKQSSDTDLATRAGAVCTALIPDGPEKKCSIEHAAFSMPVDLVLIESRRHGLFPKLLVLPPEAGAAEGDNETVALVTRRKDTNSVYFNTLHVDNISALTKYIKLLANL